MNNYTLWTYDVWGNNRDGFEVNDRRKHGTIELPDDATDSEIVRAVNRELETHVQARSISIEGEAQYTLYLTYNTTRMSGYPWAELEREKE